MIERLLERAAIKLAWLLPHRLVMWCFYRVAANATQGQWGNENPHGVSIMDAADRWTATKEIEC